MPPRSWNGHTAGAKNSSGFLRELERIESLNKETGTTSEAITQFMKGDIKMDSLVDKLSQNRNISLDNIDQGLEAAGVGPKTRQRVNIALQKIRQRTMTRIAGKDEDTPGQKLMKGLLSKPSVALRGKPTEPKTAYEAIANAIKNNQKKLANVPISTEDISPISKYS